MDLQGEEITLLVFNESVFPKLYAEHQRGVCTTYCVLPIARLALHNTPSSTTSRRKACNSNDMAVCANSHVRCTVICKLEEIEMRPGATW